MRTWAIYIGYLFAHSWMKTYLNKLGSLNLHLRLGTHDHLSHPSFSNSEASHVASNMSHTYAMASYNDHSMIFLLTCLHLPLILLLWELNSQFQGWSLVPTFVAWLDSSLSISKNTSWRVKRGFHRSSSNSLLVFISNIWDEFSRSE